MAKLELGRYSFSFGDKFLYSPCDNCETTLKCSEFFALEVGRFVEYDVSEEEVALGWPAINRAYQWKERIAESYIDLAGDKVHRIARFRRTLDSQPWKLDLSQYD